MTRLDRDGRDVTHMPGLWSEEDCEITETNYPHPSITSGQHTNGPASIWIRLADGKSPWIQSPERTMHHTLQAWVSMGIEWFALVDEEWPKK